MQLQTAVRKRMKNYAVYVVGNYERIAIYELTAILETYNIQYKIVRKFPQVLFIKADEQFENIFYKRFAFSHFLIEIMDYFDIFDIKTLNIQLNGFLKDHIITQHKDVSLIVKKIGQTMHPITRQKLFITIKDMLEKKIGQKLTFKNPKLTYVCILTLNTFILGFLVKTSARKDVLKRGPKYRPYNHPATLPSDLSRAMVNIAHLKQQDTLLDPFCGVGTVVIEGCTSDVYSVGMDIDKKMIFKALKNAEYFNCRNYSFILGNTLKMPIKGSKNLAIVTDPPYGRAASTKGTKIYQLYSDFLENASSILRKDRFLVFISPHYLPISKILEKNDFKVVKKFYVRYHSKLTRVINVTLPG